MSELGLYILMVRWGNTVATLLVMVGVTGDEGDGYEVEV